MAITKSRKPNPPIVDKKLTKEQLQQKADSLGMHILDGSLTELAKSNAGVTERTGLVKNLKSAVTDPYHAETLAHLLKNWKLDYPRNDEEIYDRTDMYLNDCFLKEVRPTLEGFALAIGVDAETLLNWSKKDPLYDHDRFTLAKQIRMLVRAFDSQAVADNKLGERLYIFRAKNYYEMKDQIETVNKTESLLGEKKSKEEIIESIKSDVIDVEFEEN